MVGVNPVKEKTDSVVDSSFLFEMIQVLIILPVVLQLLKLKSVDLMTETMIVPSKAIVLTVFY